MFPRRDWPKGEARQTRSESALTGWIFSRFFGSSGPKPPVRDLRELTLGLTRPAVRLAKRAGDSRSYFGGMPRLPPGSPWPTSRGVPLAFLARVDLSDLHAVQPLDWLPPDGALLFFYDCESQPWGFDPEDRGKWSVIHIADGIDSPARVSAGRAILPATVLPRVGIDFQRIESHPSVERDEICALQLSDEESDLYIDIADESFQGQPQHQIGGYPREVQGDNMEMECQLVSRGIYCGTPEGYADPRATELAKGAHDWRLLLQFDSDDELQVMWGDAGKIYFWVREQDARAGSFTSTWVVLQCY